MYRAPLDQLDITPSLGGASSSSRQAAPDAGLSATERHQLLVAWNETAAPYPRDQCLHELFAAQVARTPEAIAVVFGEDYLTYGQLNERANQLARYLQTCRVRPQDRVGLLLQRSTEYVISVLAILKVGAAYVPLAGDLPAARLGFLLRDAGIQSVIGRAEAMPPELASCAVRFLNWNSLESATAALATNDLPSVTGATDLAYVMYTSGSTGTPKGVAVPHRAIVRLVCGTDYVPFAPPQVFLLLAPVQFDASTWELWGALLHGSRLVIYPHVELDLPLLHHFLSQHQVTCLWLTAALFNVIVTQQPECLRDVKHLVIGGEALSVPHVQRALACLPTTQIINGYGPTEGTTFTTTYAIPRPLPPTIRTIPIGRPIANTQVYVLDEQLQPVPIGTPGELYIGGDGLARGYLHQPQLTADRFIAHPFVTDSDARLYRTGDRCRYLPDGNLEFLGRLDQQIKLRGFRIELGEIETVLNAHTQVGQTVVTLREDGPDEKYLAAYVVPRNGASPTVAELRNHLSQQLPDYMVPGVFVFLSALPLNANGKLDRAALPPPDKTASAGRTYAAPCSETERQLAAIWADVLNRSNIGIHDNFLLLGGHSLSAIRIVARIRSELQLELPQRAIFEFNTIVTLGREIERLQSLNPSSLVSSSSSAQGQPLDLTSPQCFPASLNQAQLWFLQQCYPLSTAYNLAHKFRWRGQLNLPALPASWSALVQRHAALRTRFVLQNDTLFQKVLADSKSLLSLTDLSAFSPTAREAELERLAREEFSRPFDLLNSSEPRVQLIRLAPDDHVLLFGIHHILSDGWSLELLARDLAALYAGEICEHVPVLAPAGNYADFVTWQQQALTSAAIERHLTFWREQLAHVPDLLTLPFLTKAPLPETRRGSRHSSWLAPATVTELRALGAAHGCSLFATLLAGFQIAMHRATDQSQFVLGVPFAGRPDCLPAAIAGCFVNALPVRCDLSGDLNFIALVRQTQEQLWLVQSHQDFPFAKLVEALRPQRRSDRNPIFQILVGYEDLNHSIQQLPELTMELQEVDPAEALFDDLTLLFRDGPRGLECVCLYPEGWYESARLEEFAAELPKILAAAVSKPLLPLAHLYQSQRVSPLELAPPFNPNANLNRAALPPPDSNATAGPEHEAPRTETERQLAAIWADVLRRPNIGIHDNFFDLGGHSLLALRVVSETNRKLSTNLRVATLFQHPTIAALTEALPQSDPGTTGATLVPLRSGHFGVELYFILDEGSLGLLPLARLMDRDLRVFGSLAPLPPAALAASARRQTRHLPGMAELARPHVRLIQQQQQSRPCLLAGRCFGGVLAFEIARQLQQAGTPVTAVLMLDSWLQPPPRFWWYRTWLQTHVRNCFQQGPKYLSEKLRTRIALAKIKRAGAGVSPDPTVLPGGVLPPVIERVYRHALQTYQPQLLASRGVLLHSRDDWAANAFLRRHPTLGAAAFFAGGCQLVPVPGDHVTVLYEQNLPAVGAQFARLLKDFSTLPANRKSP
jgi:amino acid adenylation domain-containing protein